jgi:hypothetical protein
MEEVLKILIILDPAYVYDNTDYSMGELVGGVVNNEDI